MIATKANWVAVCHVIIFVAELALAVMCVSMDCDSL